MMIKRNQTDNTQVLLRIATLNLLNFIEPPLACYESDNIYTQVQWQKKCRWLETFLQQESPDVIAFQEVFSPLALESLLAPLGYHWFAVVDQPKVLSDYIYHDPVTAIASKYPIVGKEPVSANPQVAVALGLDSGFNFSRLPLYCRIVLPAIGEVDFYVVHFKSKRPSLKDESLLCLKDESANQMLMTSLGRVYSNFSRGAEAAVLMQAIVAKREQSHRPVILLGDFNDTLDSDLLKVLQVDEAMSRWQTGNNCELQPGIDFYGLRNSFSLYQLNAPDVKNTPTHYWGAQGSVLDYILLSAEFDPRSPLSTLDLVNYQVIDKHLVRPDYQQDSESSDHAAVIVSLAPRN